MVIRGQIQTPNLPGLNDQNRGVGGFFRETDESVRKEAFKTIMQSEAKVKAPKSRRLSSASSISVSRSIDEY